MNRAIYKLFLYKILLLLGVFMLSSLNAQKSTNPSEISFAENDNYPRDFTQNINTTLLGRWVHGGQVSAVTTVDNLIYFTSGPYLEIADITDPAHPQRLGKILLPTSARDLTKSGNYVYVADASAGFHIIDVSDPYAPVETGSLFIPGYAQSVDSNNNYVYLGTGIGKLMIIDVSDPANPVLTGSIVTAGVNHKVVVIDNYAYLSNNDGLTIIDVSDPVNPLEIFVLKSGEFKFQVQQMN